MLLKLFGRESAFKEPDFRLFFYGQAISSIGTWLQSAALSWLVFQLTHSGFMVGLNGALMVAPTVVLLPLAGAIVDGSRTKKVLLIATFFGMLQAIALAAVVLSGNPALWELNALTLFLGMVNAFEGTARHTSIAELVPLADIPSATALNSSLVSAGMMLGTALAGGLIWSAGIGFAFLLNAMSFVPVIFTVMGMKFHYASSKHSGRSIGQVLSGFSYVFKQNPELRLLLGLVFTGMALGFPYRTLMPALTKVFFGGSALVFGTLGAMPGLGSLVAGIAISRHSKRLSFKATLVAGQALIGASLLAFSVNHNITFGCLLLFLAGFGGVVSVSLLRSRVQMVASRNFVGRVTSINLMVFLSGIALGNLVVGRLGQSTGLPFAIGLCGIALLLLAGLTAKAKQLK